MHATEAAVGRRG